MKRIAILIEKNQSVGSLANISAILMGELCTRHEDIYSNNVVDKNQCIHASIHYSTIILKANSPQQITNLINKIKSEDIYFAIFSQIGKGLHNKFDDYKNNIMKESTTKTVPVGIIVYGEEKIIKNTMKKFSIFH